MARPDQKGSFLESISPWNISRSVTPQSSPNQNADGQDVLQRSQGEDHTVTRRHKLSLRHYPKDCPSLRVRWFYAVDSPKRKPPFSNLKKKDEPKPLPPPKKFVPFSVKDSQSIEASFHRLSKAETTRERNDSTEQTPDEPVKVPVNEDYLYDVDIEQRELSPAYWTGPVYEVRRGTWFFQEGSTFKPCEENLATQLEEGFLKVRPWRLDAQKSARPSTASKPHGHDNANMAQSPDPSMDVPHSKQPDPPENHAENVEHITPTTANEPQNHRLFGAYMNSIATYQDSSTALLRTDDFLARVSTTVYEKLGGVAGTRVIRGFTEAKKQKEIPDSKEPDRKPPQESPSSVPEEAPVKTEPGPVLKQVGTDISTNQDHDGEEIPGRSPRSTLERQMSSLAGEPQNAAELEEEARRQEEKEMEDSREVENEDRERGIDHLVLVTHGIGQRLGLRLDSINFVSDINVMRKTMKSVYKASPDLQALNSQFADSSRNCRVQVLPVCWRHLLDFPYRGVRQNRQDGKEHDLADADTPEDDIYPGLADITLDSVPAVRNLISDLCLDVLMYQSRYCEQISRTVGKECNRIFKLFKERNPSFSGSVSLCGHSLGSAILFDILCHQHGDLNPSEHKPKTSLKDKTQAENRDHPLNFECEEFFCLGSPIALFQMLKGQTIAGRPTKETRDSKPLSKLESHVDSLRESASTSASASAHHSVNVGVGPAIEEGPGIVSSPNCRQLYNIFHPSDPVSYRIEPLISPTMSSLRPQPLPSVKKSLWAAPGQSLSIIGNRVGQSVGSMWSNFTSGAASSLLNRRLGLNSEDTPPQAVGLELQQTRQPSTTDSFDDNPPTLIEPELETLYDGFQKTRINGRKAASQSSTNEDTSDGQDSEDRLRKLKIEDAKVRRLNSNGRVDYSIQEGAFDISLIASIASHLTYWADEDVNHFMLSQMLSRRSRNRNL